MREGSPHASSCMHMCRHMHAHVQAHVISCKHMQRHTHKNKEAHRKRGARGRATDGNTARILHGPVPAERTDKSTVTQTETHFTP
jgi:hypothetical protein